ncbi:uncharacterized protein EV420DRAFT_119190 [Desarmillaria tabescens]|uniref:Uncharacterized protein n=1 Tax=Armillaria tabescens TaxID=1929756 RepID=A0AA39N9Q1_ARMTA|nr:uncharacterized protein EV420DRAFT_119190 [Desarmillaria tabescens]KAK0461627.1 hypothetical protein EV420DRAFT_119190 [Desarmillaria tabescens]
MSNIYKPPNWSLQQHSSCLFLRMKLFFAFLLMLAASVTTQALYLNPNVQAPSRRAFLAAEAEPSKEDAKRSD